MNPIKFVEAQETIVVEGIKSVEIDNTKWFDAAKKEPGQPGVFEVNPVSVFDGEDQARRFSYFDGKKFGPVSSTPRLAFDIRFTASTQAASIAAFRGLAE